MELWFLLLETIILERNISAVDVLITIKDVMFLVPLSWQSKEIYVSMLTFVYKYIFKYLYVYLSICILS